MSSSYRPILSEETLNAAIADAEDEPATLIEAELLADIAITEKIIPANLLVHHVGGAKFVLSDASNLTFEGIGIADAKSAIGAIKLTTAHTKGYLFYSHPDELQISQSASTFTTRRDSSSGLADVAHGYATGQRVRYFSGGTVVGGLVNNTDYYVSVIDTYKFRLAPTRANALAGTNLINFTSGGVGMHVIAASPVKWTGAKTPYEVSFELFDAPVNSFQGKLNAISSAFIGKKVKILASPSPFTDQSGFLAEGHRLYFRGGEYPNSFSNRWGCPLMIEPNVKITGDSPRLYESALNGYPRLIAPVDDSKAMGEISVTGLYISKSPSASGNVNDSTVSIGNVSKGIITHNVFDGCRGYGATAGQTSSENSPRAENVEVCYNLFKNCPTQVAFTPNSRITRWHHNTFDMRNIPSGAGFIPMDMESNTQFDLIEYIELTDNLFIYPAHPFTANVHGIALNPARSAGIKRALIARNRFEGGRYRFGTNAPFETGFYAFGVEELTVSDNYISGAWRRAYNLRSCRYVRFLRNEAEACGWQNLPDAALLSVTGVADSVIADNFKRLTKGAEYADKIYEREFYSFFTAATNRLTSGVHENVPFSHWVGLNVKYNGVIYKINSFTIGGSAEGNYDPYLVSDQTIGTVTAKTYVASNITIATGNIQITAHGFQTGALVRRSSTGTLPVIPGGITLEPDIEADYFTAPLYIHRIDDDNLKLAPTEADAIAGTNLITYEAAGTGTHKLEPILKTLFANNIYEGNGCDVVRMEASSASKVLSRADGSKPELNFTEFSSPVYLTEADAGKTFQDAGKLTPSYFFLPVNPRNNLRYEFMADSGGGIKIFAGKNSRISYEGVQTAPNGTLESSGINSNVELYSAGGNWKTRYKQGSHTRGDASGSPVDVNFAAAAQGASALASNVETGFGGIQFVASNAINGIKHTSGNYLMPPGGFWSGGSSSPQHLDVTFSEAKTIKEIGIVFLANTGDGLNYNSDPAINTANTLSSIGVTSYELFYWNGTAWVEIADVTGNTKAHPVHSFSAVTTIKIRVNCRASGDNYLRVVEIQAFNRS